PDNYYKLFSEVYSTDTTEMYCPSLQNRKSRNMPKKAEKKFRVLYACRKISDEQYQLLQTFIDSIEYSCGVTFKDISDLTEISEQNKLNNKEVESEEIVIKKIKKTERKVDPIAELFKLFK
ncbi:4452_t:CDS:2, partial [Funneliformis geosporum]